MIMFRQTGLRSSLNIVQEVGLMKLVMMMMMTTMMMMKHDDDAEKKKAEDEIDNEGRKEEL